MLLILMFLFPLQVFAYLDLGSGSYFLQMLLAVGFTALVGFRSFWYKVSSIFQRKKKNKEVQKEDSGELDNGRKS